MGPGVLAKGLPVAGALNAFCQFSARFLHRANARRFRAFARRAVGPSCWPMARIRATVVSWCWVSVCNAPDAPSSAVTLSLRHFSTTSHRSTSPSAVRLMGTRNRCRQPFPVAGANWSSSTNTKADRRLAIDGRQPFFATVECLGR